MNCVHRLAKEYRDAGISVIPLRLDGSKEPDGRRLPQVCRLDTKKQSGTWESFMHRLAEDCELADWFGRGQCGVGMVCGVVSGGLEVLDFDDGSLFDPWRKLVPHIVDRLPVIETPSGGWHVLFRCNEICGNSKIAKDPNKADKKTLIETRGERGYVVAEGSPCKTHPTGLPYVQYSGPYLPMIPMITPSERRDLWCAARTFDKQPAIVRERLARKAASVPLQRIDYTAYPSWHQDSLVINDFNRRCSWDDVLTPFGWSSLCGRIWTRPGKDFGKSAGVCIAADGSEVLVVFSGNCGVLAPVSGDHATWSKFRAWTALKFSGNYGAAIQAAKQGVAA